MTAQELKNSILQWAIQGKLVEQRVEEGTAKELIEQIKAEKEQLIKDKKIKKEKPLPEITEDEIPFDIPESWKWVRLRDLVSILGDGIHGTPNYDDLGDYYFINGNNLMDGQIVIKENTKVVNKQEYEKYKKELNNSTVLVSINGTIGNIAFYNNEKVMLGKSACYFNLIQEHIKYYLYWVIKTKYFLEYAVSNATGSTIKNVSLATMKNFVVPLPPLEEQKRIVAKIEELMPYVEQYDKAYTKLEAFNKKFPEDMQKSILQYAIQGKLVKQRAEEGTAEELYQQIQEEKVRLIKEGKIKKEKPLPEITEDEIPFDIPESWKWVRLRDLVSILGDGIHGTPNYDDLGDYYFINGNNLIDGKIVIKENTKVVGKQEYEKYKKELNNSTVFVSINGTIGNVAFYNNEKVILGKSACYFNLIEENIKYYLYWVIKTKYFLEYAVNNATGSTIKNVSLATMKNFVVPLPPLEEQKRIVAKIEEMLPYCQQLVK